MNNILTDLDDFLAPSQDCIKMIIPQSNKDGKDLAKPGGGQDGDIATKNTKARVQIGNDFDDIDFEMKVDINPKQ